MDVRIGSDLYLAGSPAELQAWCRVPSELIAGASPHEPRYGSHDARDCAPATPGSSASPRCARHVVVTGRIGMGHGTCGRGAYKVWRYEPRR